MNLNLNIAPIKAASNHSNESADSIMLAHSLCLANSKGAELVQLCFSLESLGVAYDNLCAIKEAIVKHGGATESLIALVGDSFNGTISVEATEEKKASIWDRIKAILLRLWYALVDVITHFTDSNKILLRKIGKWIKQADSDDVMNVGTEFKGLEEDTMDKQKAKLDDAIAAVNDVLAMLDTEPVNSAASQPESEPLDATIHHKTKAAALRYAKVLYACLDKLIRQLTGFTRVGNSMERTLKKESKNPINGASTMDLQKSLVVVFKKSAVEIKNILTQYANTGTAFLANNKLKKLTTDE